MSSQRYSDENLNPQDESINTVDNQLEVNDAPAVITLKTETEGRPFAESNDSEVVVKSKKLTPLQRKHKTRFEKSGMKAGALFTFLHTKKPNSEDSARPSTSSQSMSQQRNLKSNARTNSTVNPTVITKNGSGIHGETSVNQNASVHQDQNEPCSQESVEYLGEVPKVPLESQEVVDISSEAGEVSNEGTQRDENDVSSNDIDGDLPNECGDHGESDFVEETHFRKLNNNTSFVLPLLDETAPMTGRERVENWHRVNKRIYAISGQLENEIPPPKISRFDDGSVDQLPRESNTEQSLSSAVSSPIPKIVEVFTLGNSNVSVTTTGASPSSSSSLRPDRMKKPIPLFKEFDNAAVASLIEKTSLRKALEKLKEDLTTHKLPKKIYVSQLIKKAILCDNTRVAKVVQNESIAFLEKLIMEYPPQDGNPSVMYYKEIFEEVYEDLNDGDQSGDGYGCRLFQFLRNVWERVEADTSRIDLHVPRLLFLVTKLAIDQYKVYENEKLKLKPPLFQHFLEEDEGTFKYNSSCRNVISKLFGSASSYPDLFCIFIEWFHLIARRLEKFQYAKKEYWKMVNHVKEKCLERDDLGLQMFLNCDYKQVAKDVCERIFDDKFKVIPEESDNRSSSVSDVERNSYLTDLGETLLIVPATKIISDLKEHECQVDGSLKYKTTRAEWLMECDNETGQEKQRDRKKNLKGETRLHKICGPSRSNNSNIVNEERSEFAKHLRTNPNDINVPDNFGNTPLHDCARNNKGHLIFKLMDLHGSGQLPCPVNLLAYNKSLETSMHLAATFCTTQHTDFLKNLARNCGCLDDLLLTPNKDGKLPFELVEKENPGTISKLLPEGYDEEVMLVRSGFKLDSHSASELKQSFALRKLLAWWNKNCMQS